MTQTQEQPIDEKLEATLADRLTKLLLIRFKNAYPNLWDSQIKAKGDAQAREHSWKIMLNKMLTQYPAQVIADSINSIAYGEVQETRNPNFRDFPPTMPQFAEYVRERAPRVMTTPNMQLIESKPSYLYQSRETAIANCKDGKLKARLEKLNATLQSKQKTQGNFYETDNS